MKQRMRLGSNQKSVVTFKYTRGASICMKTRSVETQMERSIPVEIFREKWNAFRGFALSSFFPE